MSVRRVPVVPDVPDVPALPVVLVVAVMVVVALVLAVACPLPSAQADEANRWVQPVDGPVARAFAPPRTRYGAGHLGVDFAVASGTAVRAAGAGVVTFAGVIAGTRHVVVAHDDGLRTSYSFLASIAVSRGQHVQAGERLGASGGTGEGHDGTVLHFGLRHGDQYVDPMVLFEPVDLARVVHLVPAHDGPRFESEADARRSVLDGLRGLAGTALHVSASAVTAAGRAGRTVVSKADTALGLPDPTEIASSLTAWLRERSNCDAHAPAADGTGGSGHRVMVVAGINSHRAADGASLDVPFRDLGYQAGEATYFSYADDGGAYDAADTHRPIMESARLLAEQLQEMQQREPGREVDLVAHSQGGVVVLAFLALVYDSHDPAYPPLGTVVTLSSPLQGAPLATAGGKIARTESGRQFLALTDRATSAAGLSVPPTRAASVRDLAEDSDFMQRLDQARLPGTVDLTTIGATADPVVPAVTASRGGAQHVDVATSPFAGDPHTAVETDADALKALRAALERRPVPCESWTTALATALVSPTIAQLERNAGTVGEWAGRLAGAR